MEPEVWMLELQYQAMKSLQMQKLTNKKSGKSLFEHA